jgi:threonine synthase
MKKGKFIKRRIWRIMRADITAVSVTDTETKNTIAAAWDNYRLLLEPHGAVGWAALQQYVSLNTEPRQDELFVVLETAHPAKFPEQIQEILGFDPELPPSLQNLEDKKENYELLDNGYEHFKAYLVRGL